jgi:hypothetical protein
MEGLQMKDNLLTEEQAEVQRVKEVVMKAIEGDVEKVARLIASKADGELFGKTEFDLRDLVHRLGSHALEATVDDRKKGGTRAAAQVAQTATVLPALWGGGRKRT